MDQFLIDMDLFLIDMIQFQAQIFSIFLLSLIWICSKQHSFLLFVVIDMNPTTLVKPFQIVMHLNALALGDCVTRTICEISGRIGRVFKTRS